MSEKELTGGGVSDLENIPFNKRLRKPRKAVLETLDRFPNKQLDVLRLKGHSSLLVSMTPETIQKHIDFLVENDCIVLSERDNKTIATLTAEGQYYLKVWREQEKREKEIHDIKYEEAMLARGAIPKLPHVSKVS